MCHTYAIDINHDWDQMIPGFISALEHGVSFSSQNQ